MSLSDLDIELAIVSRLLLDSQKGGGVTATSEGDFARSLRLAAPACRVRRVITAMVSRKKICRSRQWQAHADNWDRPVTFWLSSQEVPDCVLAYRR